MAESMAASTAKQFNELVLRDRQLATVYGLSRYRAATPPLEPSRDPMLRSMSTFALPFGVPCVVFMYRCLRRKMSASTRPESTSTAVHSREETKCSSSGVIPVRSGPSAAKRIGGRWREPLWYGLGSVEGEDRCRERRWTASLTADGPYISMAECLRQCARLAPLTSHEAADRRAQLWSAFQRRGEALQTRQMEERKADEQASRHCHRQRRLAQRRPCCRLHVPFVLQL